MSTHTKGPWQAMPRFQDHIEVRHSCPREGAASRVVARVTVRSTWENEQTANARLVAAAPDLLDALQAAFEYLDMIPESAAGGCDEAVRIARKARAAIAKATGKQA